MIEHPVEKLLKDIDMWPVDETTQAEIRTLLGRRTIRILRTIEYEYNDVDVMIRDMSHWGLGAQASHDFGHGRVRSSVLLPSLTRDGTDEWWESIQNLGRKRI